MAETDNSGASAPKQRGSAKPARGRPFLPGQSGNPGGRPKGDIARAIREQTRDGMELVAFLMAVVRGDSVALKAEARIPDRVKATELLFERGWGKAAQPLEHAGPDGESLSIVIDLGARG